jgi:DNA-binding MurR/RpiR family transcriptional regulator
MSDTTAISLRELLRDRRLSPSQRRIARYLLAHGDETVFLTGSELAERAGVSQPSVTRFAAALGFTGFHELRAALRATVLESRRPAVGRPPTNEVQGLVEAEIQGLEALRERLADTSQLRAVAESLVASTPLPVVGLRISAPAAQFFGYLTGKVLPDVRILDRPGSLLEDGLAGAARAGATSVLAMGLPRYPRELLDGLRWARRLGLRVVLVTDQPVGPLADLADETLVAPVNSDLVFDSHATVAVLCTALAHTMLDVLGREGHARLEEFDASAAERGVFVDG